MPSSRRIITRNKHAFSGSRGSEGALTVKNHENEGTISRKQQAIKRGDATRQKKRASDSVCATTPPPQKKNMNFQETNTLRYPPLIKADDSCGVSLFCCAHINRNLSRHFKNIKRLKRVCICTAFSRAVTEELYRCLSKLRCVPYGNCMGANLNPLFQIADEQFRGGDGVENDGPNTDSSILEQPLLSTVYILPSVTRTVVSHH